MVTGSSPVRPTTGTPVGHRFLCLLLLGGVILAQGALERLAHGNRGRLPANATLSRGAGTGRSAGSRTLQGGKPCYPGDRPPAPEVEMMVTLSLQLAQLAGWTISADFSGET